MRDEIDVGWGGIFKWTFRGMLFIGIIFTAVYFLMVAVTPLSLGFKWVQEGARIISPENVREQFRFAYDTLNDLEGAAQTVCLAETAVESTSDEFIRQQRITQALAYENNYYRLQQDYDARMQDVFRAKVVKPGDVPDRAPSLETTKARVCAPTFK